MGIIYGYIEIYANSINKKTPWLNSGDIKNKKTSDTIFIMGSGRSINNYSEKQWKDIVNSDSLGFNFWLLHEFIPSYYMYELPRDKKMKEDFLYNLEHVEEEYRNTLIFLKEGNNGKKNSRVIPTNIFKQTKVLFNPTIPIIEVSQLERALKFIQKTINKKDNRKIVVFNKRASLFSAVLFSYLCGYKNIVLCGVDLNNTSYFYEENAKEIINRGLRVPNTGQRGNIHKTDNSEYGEVTISELLKGLDNVILRPNNIMLYTGSKESALYDWLPYYWEE
ncbi:MAG TPA: hypothetical protein GX708_19795 [Gallicola sp.]|nr:hypothetical protein [Gallicola sp.]